MRKLLGVLLAVSIVLVTVTDLNAGKGYSSGGRSYSSSSSSSRSSSPPSSSRSSSSSSSKPSSGYSSGNKSYSSGSKGYSSGASSPSKSPSSKPSGGFQTLPAAQQRKAEARTAYQQSTAPKESYKTPKGNVVTIKKNDKRVTSIRNMPEDKWVTRETRVQTFYHSYYSHPPVTVVHYNDPYNTFFWLWMLDRSVNDRAYWAYHHRHEMDEARYRDLLAKDRALEARVKQLEAEKLARDPNFVPAGMQDPDLQYTDDFVNASRNPTLRPSQPTNWGAVGRGIWTFIKWCFYIALTGVVIWLLVWLIFYKKW
jgi:hypothetical protein